MLRRGTPFSSIYPPRPLTFISPPLQQALSPELVIITTAISWHSRQYNNALLISNVVVGVNALR